MKKKLLSGLMACLVAVSLCVPAMAADLDYATRAADALHAAGLFNGTGVDAAGKPIYELERTATRAEGVTMLVRVLGKEQEANAGHYQTPFTDVPAWARGFVGYAYENKLTSGVSASEFGTNMTVSATQYLTFVLVALGYEKGVDFAWNTSYELAEALGIIEEGEWRNNERFTRDDMVVISYRALRTYQKESDKRLAESLGVNDLPWVSPVNPAHVPESDLRPETVPVSYVDAEDPNNLLPDNFGNMGYDFYGAGEGTVVRHSDLKMGSNNANENIGHFFETMNRIDGNVKNRKGNELSYMGDQCGSYKVDGNNYKLEFNFMSTKVGRNVFLNGLHYFGGDMGVSVFRMFHEHYFFRSNDMVPISSELAAKYGLTITMLEEGEVSWRAKVSDGTDTWEIKYGCAGYDNFKTFIYIPA